MILYCNQSKSMKKGFADFCINFDKAEKYLEKYEENPDVQKLLTKSAKTL